MNKRSRSARHSSRDPDAIAFARDQRVRANEFARDVWQIVRNRGCRNQKFRREYPIPPYTADFCCVALKLIVEVDGEHHQTDEGRERDKRRDRYLAEQGYTLQLHNIRQRYAENNWYSGSNRVLFACRGNSRFVNCRYIPSALLSDIIMSLFAKTPL